MRFQKKEVRDVHKYREGGNRRGYGINCSLNLHVLLLFLLLALLTVGCGSSPKVKPSFYHWKSNFEPAAEAFLLLERLKVKQLYVRYFDVDWPRNSARAQPIAQLTYKTLPPKGVEIIPTIYITNKTLLKTQLAEIDTLTDRIWRRIQVIQAVGPKIIPREIQIDCDWSSKTRAKYFKLLEGLRNHFEKDKIKLSVTIRLHQIKFRKQTGIPPADRGMLMFYNMGNLDDPKEVNSILDLETGRTYLSNFEAYALPLDIALPIFSWGVLIRQKRPIKLIHQMEMPDTDPGGKFKKLGPQRVKVLESHYFRGYYLYAGDEIRLERVSETALLEAAELLASVLPDEPRTIALYHLDTLTLKNYAPEFLENIYRTFH